MEKMYAVGRIPRWLPEARSKAFRQGVSWTARMIDRPIRPGFVDGFGRKFTWLPLTLVADGELSARHHLCSRCFCGSWWLVRLSMALLRVRIGRNIDTGESIVNLTYEEEENSDSSS